MRLRSGLVVVVSVVLVLAGFLGTSAGSASAAADSPDVVGGSGVLLVDANLKEAFQPADVADPTDMYNFVDRLLAQVPRVPDILTLQEVVGPSTENVAEELTRRTGHEFRIAVAPGTTAFIGSGRKRETAIVFNADTMRAPLDLTGYIETGTVNPDTGEQIKQNARAQLIKIGDGTRIALASVHLDPADHDKGASAATLATALDVTYPSDSASQIEVIAGDFNRRRCNDADTEAADCTPSPHWDVLVNGSGYTDSHYTMGDLSRRIDYVFTTAQVLAAGTDPTRKTDVAADDAGFAACDQLFLQGLSADGTDSCRGEYYSDHNFQWAVLTP